MTKAQKVVAEMLGDEMDPEVELAWLISRDEYHRILAALKKAQRPNRSQYADEYLRLNGEAGPGKGVTTGSFLSARLRGNAKRYGGHYKQALVNSLEQHVEAGLATKGRSRNGGEAYYPVDAETLAKLKERFNLG